MRERVTIKTATIHTGKETAQRNAHVHLCAYAVFSFCFLSQVTTSPLEVPIIVLIGSRHRHVHLLRAHQRQVSLFFPQHKGHRLM